VKSEPGHVYTPGSFKAIREEGMPMKNKTFIKGSLYVEFDVVFPKSGELDQKTRLQLQKLLPGPPPESKSASSAAGGGGAGGAAPGGPPTSSSASHSGMETDSKDGAPVEEDVTLTDVNIEQERQKNEQQAKEAYHDDENDDRPRQGGAGCRAQ